MISSSQVSKVQSALPFWLSLALIPLIWISATTGGWWVLIVPLVTWYGIGTLDFAVGLNLENADPETQESDLYWYRLLTTLWPPLQFLTLFGLLWFTKDNPDFSSAEKIGLFFSMGVISGTIGINYSHELMHQQSHQERWLGDILLAMVLYSHFRSEHLLVHHRYVGTPRDPVTARYNEGFHRFFPRVLIGCLKSAFRAEKEKLARGNRAWTHISNPFFRYWALQGAMLLLALVIGGWTGFFLFLWQAYIAIWQLEIVNYIEHYGLTREHLGGSKYEHVKPQHSWNATHKASNWLLINLQRHSDHHYKPNRRFPLLQNYAENEAPQLPYSYPVMTVSALFPPLWKRVMNPRVRSWRATYYPHITDWKPYNKATNPPPR